MPDLGQNRLDLDAPEQFSSADDEVVAFALSPGLRDSEAAVGGFAHKSKLGQFAPMFTVEICIRWFGLQGFFRDAQGSLPKRWLNAN